MRLTNTPWSVANRVAADFQSATTFQVRPAERIMNRSTAHEWFDVVDDQDRPVGRATRADVHARGLKHRAVHIWLFNARGELFLQKRSDTKDSAPDCWDSSASGHLDSGEEYDACAVRELREELGLEVQPTQLERLFKLDACADTGSEFVWVYRIRSDATPVINPAEIKRGAWVTQHQLDVLVTEQPHRCARSFVRITREMFTRGFWP
jgi:isopentenyl-diphosphate delta-isomerase type 1